MAKCKASPAVSALQREFIIRRDEEQAAHLMCFFKTGPGQYGEGDRFLGIKVPVTRSLVKAYAAEATPADCDFLVQSEWHEVRLAGFLLMVEMAKRRAKTHDIEGVREVVDLYDKRLERANNWDLIDLSVKDILFPFWTSSKAGAKERLRLLDRWADSGMLWRERAAMVGTLAAQKLGSLDETFRLAERFIVHPHDLMHKASGWMLREAGKKDLDALRAFLAAFHKKLPRTALRYAIERMAPAERQKWMAR